MKLGQEPPHGFECSCGNPGTGCGRRSATKKGGFMDRRTLESLYSASRGSPTRVFNRALSEKPLGSDTRSFLLNHVDELDADHLVALLGARVALDDERNDKPFLRRLAGLLPFADTSTLLEALRLSEKINAEAWIEDLVLPLRGRLPNYQWYRFVDKARGHKLFNALNVGLAPYASNEPGWNPDESFVTSIEEARQEPVVVKLLHRAHDDGDVAKLVIDKTPLDVVLRLHRQFPDDVTEDAIKAALPGRVASPISWASASEPLPAWMAPFVVERVRRCEDHEEAKNLYEWLAALPAGAHDWDAYTLAVERFKRNPISSFWHARIGSFLNTGGTWKTRGRSFIDLCIELGRGFPPAVLHVALGASSDGNGPSAEDHRKPILRRIHEELAKLLVERADHALRVGDRESADLYLSALLSLDAGSFIGGPLHRLRKIDQLPDGVLARLDACQEMAKAGGRSPTEEGFFEAFLVLTGQLR
ncbi:MAG: hypothetical protein KF795_10155 [Labilithrix sp.]|nr:hypothetical protein [Labilithrix sp.]